MPSTKKNTARKLLKKKTSATVVVIESRIAAKATLFPEKVTKANKILKNMKLKGLKGI